MKWWAMAVITGLAYLAMTVGVYGAYDPTPLVMEEKFELWKYEYCVDGYRIICHYIKNPKLLSGKVNTGLSCVAIPKAGVPKGTCGGEPNVSRDTPAVTVY